MIRTKPIFLISITLLLAISCKKEDTFEYPFVFTGDVTDITDTSAIFTAKLSNSIEFEILESGFIWGIHPGNVHGIKLKNTESPKPDGIYSLPANEKLLPGLTYYVRAYLRTDSATIYGREVSFTTPGSAGVKEGQWTKILDQGYSYGSSMSISCGFTVNQTTYLLMDTYFGAGVLYRFNPYDNSFSHFLTSPAIDNVSFGAVYNDTAYIFAGNAFCRFDPGTKTFIKLDSLDLNIFGVSGFLINDEIYIGLGINYDYSKRTWKYNITTDSWQEVAPFPGSYRTYAFSFSFADKGYVGGGYNLISGQWPYPKFSDLWCYESETNQWIPKTGPPLENKELYGLVGMNTDEFGYCFYQKELYEYNPVFDFWVKLARIFTNDELYYPFLFTHEGEIYLTVVREYSNTPYFRLWRYEE